MKMMQTDLREKYPVSKTYEILDGFDIHRTSAQIIAIVIIFDEKKNRNDIRFYRWFKNKYGEWKIPNMRGIMQARSKPLEVRGTYDDDKGTTLVKHTLPIAKEGCKMIDADNVLELVDLLRNEAKVI